MKAYLVPGAFEDLKARDYQAVLDAYKTAGYRPEFVSIDWKYETIDDWVGQAEAKISKKDLEGSLLSGFSWGAMIALVLAGRYQTPGRLFLFSLSPYFAEDFIDEQKGWFQSAGKSRIAAFRRISMNELAAKIDCPAAVFIGSEEIRKYKEMGRRSSGAHKRIKNSRLVVIDGAKHDVAEPNYVRAIEKELQWNPGRKK